MPILSARCLSLAPIIAFAIGSGPALAQSPAEPEANTPAPESAPADANSGGGIEDIIVTAQKRAESINQVPLSITAVSGDALIAQGISSPSDLSRIVPGLTAQPSPLNTPVYTLRGVSFFEYSLAATSTVAIYTLRGQARHLWNPTQVPAGLRIAR